MDHDKCEKKEVSLETWGGLLREREREREQTEVDQKHFTNFSLFNFNNKTEVSQAVSEIFQKRRFITSEFQKEKRDVFPRKMRRKEVGNAG